MWGLDAADIRQKAASHGKGFATALREDGWSSINDATGIISDRRSKFHLTLGFESPLFFIKEYLTIFEKVKSSEIFET